MGHRRESGRASPRDEVRIAVPQRRLFAWIAAGISVLLTAHLLAMVWHHLVAPLPFVWLSLFDLDQEHNPPTWASGMLLALDAGCFWLLSRRARAPSPFLARYWMALALGFGLLSLDEVAGLHEALNMAMAPSWAWLAAPLAIAIGLAFLPFLRALPRRTAVPLLIAGAFYLAGAVGVELFGNEMVARGDEETLGYALAVFVEEALEFAGALLCLRTLLAALAAGPSFRFSFDPRDPA